MSLLWYSLAWVLYLSLHSVLASEQVKGQVASQMPGLVRWYRLLYNAIAILGFLGLLYLHGQQEQQLLIKWMDDFSQFALALMLGGLLLAWKALRNYDIGAFAGTRQLRSSQDGIDPPEGLVTEGLHQYIRHPLYTATLLIILGWLGLDPTWPSLIAVVAMVMYLRIGIHFEEQKLRQRYGETYVAYQERVPMLFPKIPRL